MKSLFRHLFLLMVFGTLPVCAHADLAVIVSLSNTSPTLDAEQVGRIFLGKIGSFPDGRKAIPVDQPRDAPGRDEFYRLISRKTAVQLASYWARMSFTGRGMPPFEAESESEVLTMVAENPSTIGYVDARNVDGRVKVLYTLRTRPRE